MRTHAAALAIIGAALSAHRSAVAADELPQSVIYDNGTADYLNGFANGVEAVYGARRTVLDDFTIPRGEVWEITDMHWASLWDVEEPPHGTSAQIFFRADLNATPGEVFQSVVVTSYHEEPGQVFFSRVEALHTVEFDPVLLQPGKYWVEALVVGADRNWWITAPQVNGGESWVNYEDLGGLQPGSNFVHVPADLNFSFTGRVIPAAGAIWLLAPWLMCCAGGRRLRRSAGCAVARGQ